jgi:hypothetical protein
MMFDPAAMPTTTVLRHDETSTMIEEKLKEFKQEVNNLVYKLQTPTSIDESDDSSSSSSSSSSTTPPLHEEQPYCAAACETAERNCPELAGDDFKLIFLRSESFHVSDAARLWVNYWSKRLEIFGPTKAFRPMTLHGGGALEGDDGRTVATILETCQFQVLSGVQDQQGRGVAVLRFTDQTINQFDSSLVVRAAWYMGHLAFQDNLDVQRNGLVLLIKPNMNNMSDFRNFPLSLLSAAFQGAFPLNVAACHIVNPPLIFSAVFDYIQRIVGNRLGERMIVHCCRRSRAVDTNVAAELVRYGLDKSQLPQMFGGNLGVTTTTSSSSSSSEPTTTSPDPAADNNSGPINAGRPGTRMKRTGPPPALARRLRVQCRSVTCTAR